MPEHYGVMPVSGDMYAYDVVAERMELAGGGVQPIPTRRVRFVMDERGNGIELLVGEDGAPVVRSFGPNSLALAVHPMHFISVSLHLVP